MTEQSDLGARRTFERVIPETCDQALLELPLRSIADIEAIERVPLDERLPVTNFSQRMALALAARDADDTAIHYIEDGDIDRPAHETSFRDLRANIERTAALMRARGIGRNDVVAILLPAVPAIYWSILGAMSAGIAFPVNWMMEPSHVLHLIRESKARAVIALAPAPGFRIWESLMSIVGGLPADMPI